MALSSKRRLCKKLLSQIGNMIPSINSYYSTQVLGKCNFLNYYARRLLISEFNEHLSLILCEIAVTRLLVKQYYRPHCYKH